MSRSLDLDVAPPGQAHAHAVAVEHLRHLGGERGGRRAEVLVRLDRCEEVQHAHGVRRGQLGGLVEIGRLGGFWRERRLRSESGHGRMGCRAGRKGGSRDRRDLGYVAVRHGRRCAAALCAHEHLEGLDAALHAGHGVVRRQRDLVAQAHGESADGAALHLQRVRDDRPELRTRLRRRLTRARDGDLLLVGSPGRILEILRAALAGRPRRRRREPCLAAARHEHHDAADDAADFAALLVEPGLDRRVHDRPFLFGRPLVRDAMTVRSSASFMPKEFGDS
jgi:hypothetical protein